MAEDTQTRQRRFERVAEVFAQARRLAPDEWEAYLDVECGDDVKLRTEARALLEVHSDAPAAPIALVPGVPGFRILRRIGVGGMGTVYEAEQDHPRRRVALKALRLDALSDESLARFETEARALARLQHPGIARIFQAGRFEGPAGDMPYLVMDLIDGPSITRYANAKGLDRDARVQLLVDVCAAVEHAHQRGILHRDLKPPNILVPEDGRPRILDFGVAREIEEPSPHTRTGHLLGTLAYMSPEQARGEFDDLDTRCDIYALGVIGYELISGQVPHDVRDMPLLEAARVVAEQAHRSLGKDDLAIVLDKALAKDRDRRYPSASAFADDLVRVLERKPVRARRPSRLYLLRRFAQRHRTMVATIAIAIAALVFVLFKAVNAAEFARTQEAVADRARYAAQVQAATSHLDLGDVDAARSLLDETEAGQRGWMWDHLWAATDSDVDAWEFEQPADLVRGFDPARPRFWSGGAVFDRDRRLDYGSALGGNTPYLMPDGRFVSTLHNGRVRVLREDAPARHLFAVHGEVMDLDFDGARHRALVLAVEMSGACRLVLFDTRTRRAVWTHTGDLFRRALLSGDGKRVVAFAHWNGEIMVFDAATGSVRNRWRGHTSHITHVAEEPASGMIASFAMDWNIRIWDRDGKLLASIDDPGQWVHGLAFSPDGGLLASAHPRGTIRFWKPRTGAFAWAAAGRSREDVRSLAWSEDGERVICGTGDGIFERIARPSLARTELRGHATAAEGNIYPYVYDVAYSRDGKRLASVGWDETARVRDARSGRVLRTIRVPEFARVCVFAGADRLIVSADREGGTGMYDPTDGRRLAFRQINATAMSVHPACDQVAVAAAALFRVDPETLADVHPPLETEHGVTACAYAPDGDRVVCGTADGHVLIVAGDRVVSKWKAHEGWTLSAAWSRDGRRVVVGSQQGRISIFDPDSGRRMHTLYIPLARVFSFVFSHDSRLLFIGSDEHAIRVFDMEGGSGLGRLRGHRAYVKGLALSPDGSVLASASGDNTVRLWHRRTERARR